MKQRIAVVAIQHPTEPNLYLHGLRIDNGKWALPGGHAHPGETMEEAARREGREEAGLDLPNLQFMHNRDYGSHDIHLFTHPAPKDFNLDATKDPDREFLTFKWLDPTHNRNLHVPASKNILVEHLQGLSKAMVHHSAAQNHLIDSIHNQFYPKTNIPVTKKHLQTHSFDGHVIHEYEVSHNNSQPMSFFSINEDNTPEGKHMSAIRVNPHKSIPQVTTAATVTEHQGKGLNPTLYNFVAQKYGKLQSDKELTENSHKTWKKLATDPRYNVNLSGTSDPATHTLQVRPTGLNKSITPMKGVKPAEYTETTAPEYTHMDHKFKEVSHPKTPPGHKAYKVTDPQGQHNVVFARNNDEIGKHIEKLAWKPKWNLAASELEKSSSYSMHIEPFHEHANFDPKKHDFIVRLKHRGKPVGFMAMAHRPGGIMPFNAEIDKEHRGQNHSISMGQFAVKATGKSILKSPDMTAPAKKQWLKHAANQLKIKKSEFSDLLIKNNNSDYAQKAAQTLTFLYPVSIGGKTKRKDGVIHHISIKSFGPSSEYHPDALDHISENIDKYGFNRPVDTSKLRFIPHKLPAFGGGTHHVLLVSGLPTQYNKFRKDMDHVGIKIDRYLPHISIDKDTWQNLSTKGSDLSAQDIGLQVYPPELRNGNQVIKTY